MITCSTWADIWLNEGFATWTENFWWEKSGGYSAYKAQINADASNYLNGNPGWAISVPSWASTTPSKGILFNYAITYAKGACVLHMLRYTLGDSLFFASIQAYANDTNLRFHSATIADFNQKVNAITGVNYDWYFTQWIFAPNHPVYTNQFYFENPGNGNWVVHFLTKQIQANAPFFRMPIELKIHFQDNSDSLIRVMNTGNNQEYAWVFSKQPTAFTFDPGNEIVLKQATLTQGVFYAKAWTGAISEDWNNGGNWSPAGEPLSSESVIIPEGLSRYPTISSTSATCRLLNIDSGASLTVAAGCFLTLSGNAQ